MEPHLRNGNFERLLTISCRIQAIVVLEQSENISMNGNPTGLTVTVLPAPVGTRTSTKVNSELCLSIAVTTDSVERGVAVGITATILVSMNAVIVRLISVYVLAVTSVVVYFSTSIRK